VALSFEEGCKMTEFNRTESMSGVAPGGAVAAGVLREAETWASAQCELVSGMGTIWSDWLRRQQEAIDASARSLQQMFECRNPADFVQTQQQWLADATRRSASDISTLACESMALTWRLVGADRLGLHGQSPPMRGTGRAKSGDEAPAQRVAAE
jgi:hypothetical protein